MNLVEEESEWGCTLFSLFFYKKRIQAMSRNNTKFIEMDIKNLDITPCNAI